MIKMSASAKLSPTCEQGGVHILLAWSACWAQLTAGEAVCMQLTASVGCASALQTASFECGCAPPSAGFESACVQQTL